MQNGCRRQFDGNLDPLETETMQRYLWAISIGLLIFVPVGAGDPVAPDVVKATVDAVGGESQLLRLFRIKERLAIGADPAKIGSERISVLEPPGHWWLGNKDRVVESKEPATYLVWAWTLGAITDPKSKLESLVDIEHEGKPAYGIRISDTIVPPMDCYFDRASRRLVRIDWRADRHVFSNWREVDGVAYAAKVVGYKIKDDRRWYHTEIVEIERLKELPANLKR